MLQTLAAFLNSEGGDLLLGVAVDGSIAGIEHDPLCGADAFVRQLAQTVRGGLGVPAGTCIAPQIQLVQGKTLCVVSCQRSPAPVYLTRTGVEAGAAGDLFVRRGQTNERLAPEAARAYIQGRFGGTGA